MKKGLKKKTVDTFAKKEWYTLKVPDTFTNTEVGKTLVSKQSTKILLDKALIGRNFEVNQGDLNQNDEMNSLRKFKFVITEVTGNIARSEFNGMELVKDKKRGIVRKWHTLVKAHKSVVTKDGYKLRVFILGITRRKARQTSKTCYAKTSEVRKARKVIFEVINAELSKVDLSSVMKVLQGDKIGKDIEKKTISIVPLQNVFISKVKVVSRPKQEENN